MTKATKVEAGHYTYGAHEIRKVGNHWHVFEQGVGLTTDWQYGCRTLKKAKSVCDRFAEAAEKVAATLADDPALAKAFDVASDNHIVADIKGRFDKWGNLSDKQAALVKKIAADIAEREARDVGNAPTGNGRIVGRVLSVKDHYGAYGHSLKMTVELANGSRVWGTKPAAAGDLDRGDLVAFYSPKIRGADGDPTFAFFSRPSKVQVNEPVDLAQYAYDTGAIGFDEYEAAQIAALDGRADFADGEVSVCDDEVTITYDDEREALTLR